MVDNLGLTAAQRGKVKDVISALERHVDEHINESVWRRQFCCHKSLVRFLMIT